jgi:hypothetical protein
MSTLHLGGSILWRFVRIVLKVVAALALALPLGWLFANYKLYGLAVDFQEAQTVLIGMGIIGAPAAFLSRRTLVWLLGYTAVTACFAAFDPVLAEMGLLPGLSPEIRAQAVALFGVPVAMLAMARIFRTQERQTE